MVSIIAKTESLETSPGRPAARRALEMSSSLLVHE
jgi:hypothetical protein